MPESRRTRTAPRAAAPPDLDAIYAQLLAGIGGPLEVETPQLGRVTFRSTKDVYDAIMLLRMEQARAAGVQTAGVFVVTYNDGLGPSRGGC